MAKKNDVVVIDESAINIQKAEIREKIRQLRNQIEQCNRTIRSLNSENDECADAYDKLVARKRKITDQIEETLDKLRQRSSHFATNLKFARKYIDGVSEILRGDKSQASIDSLNNAISLVKKKIESNDNAIEQQRARIRSLNTQISTLESQLWQLG